MKTVLLTGIAGFLGLNLSRAFITKGWQVYGVDNLSVGCGEWLPSMVEFNQYNICFPIGYFIKFDLIIHLASRKIPRYGSAQDVLCENTTGLLNMVKFAMEANTKFVYLSTSDIYGKNKTFSETSDSIIGQPDIQRWSYAISKMWGEQLLYSTPSHFNFNIVRLFGTYGPYHALSWTAGPQSVFISQALKKEPITIHGDGFQERAFQFVDDAVDGIMRVAESCYEREIFNIGNPYEPISINMLASKIWKMINPDLPAKLTHVLPSKLKYEEIQARVPDISKAKRLLGFDPKVGLGIGLVKTIEWQRTVM